MAGWRKDGAEVDRTRDPNFIQTSDGHLLIQQARMEDAANYTCVAANAAGLERVSPPARVTVYGKRGITGKREIGWSCLCISESSVIASSKQSQFPKIDEAKIHYH